MKKLLIACGAMLLSLGASAQAFDPHFGIGAGVGTTGIAIDASATINDYFGIRAGVDIMPKFKVSKDIDLGTAGIKSSMAEITAKAKQINRQYNMAHGYGTDEMKGVVDLTNPIFNQQIPEKMDIEGKLDNTVGHILLDIHPFKTSFRVTLGAYFGKDQIIDVYNTEEGFMKPINEWNNAVLNPDPSYAALIAGQKLLGGKLGSYTFAANPDGDGNVKAYAKVNSFRPYLGIGFGRAVPKGRVGCQFDLGVQFWGKPEVYAPVYGDPTKNYKEINPDNSKNKFETIKIDGDDAGDDAGKVLKTVSKISVYPVLNFRLVGRIF